MIEYKGYIGVVEFDSDARIFHGEVINTNDVITFQGKSVAQLEKALHESVDDYLSWCEEEGVEPDKPYSGRFSLRLSPDLHRDTAIAASKEHLSLNSFVEKALRNQLNKPANRHRWPNLLESPPLQRRPDYWDRV